MSAQHSSIFDQRFPPIGNTFLQTSTSERRLDKKTEPVRRASRFQSSPPCHPLNMQHVAMVDGIQYRYKSQPSAIKSESCVPDIDVCQLWTQDSDLSPKSGGGHSAENLASATKAAKPLADSNVVSLSTVALASTADSPHHSSAADSSVEADSESVLQESNDSVAVYRQSYIQAEKAWQAVRALQQYRAGRLEEKAAVTDEKLPVLLGTPTQTPKVTAVQATAEFVPEPCIDSEESLALAQRSHQYFLDLQKHHASRHMVMSKDASSAGEEAVLPSLLLHCSSYLAIETKKKEECVQNSADQQLLQVGVAVAHQPPQDTAVFESLSSTATETRQAVLAREQRRSSRFKKESALSVESAKSLPMLLGRAGACAGASTLKSTARTEAFIRESACNIDTSVPTKFMTLSNALFLFWLPAMLIRKIGCTVTHVFDARK